MECEKEAEEFFKELLLPSAQVKLNSKGAKS